MRELVNQIEQYLVICKNEKRLSKDTLKAYGTDLKQFAGFAAGRKVDRELLSLYLQFLNKEFAPRSAKRKMASIRGVTNRVAKGNQRKRTEQKHWDCERESVLLLSRNDYTRRQKPKGQPVDFPVFSENICCVA